MSTRHVYWKHASRQEVVSQDLVHTPQGFGAMAPGTPGCPTRKGFPVTPSYPPPPGDPRACPEIRGGIQFTAQEFPHPPEQDKGHEVLMDFFSVANVPKRHW